MIEESDNLVDEFEEGGEASIPVVLLSTRRSAKQTIADLKGIEEGSLRVPVA